MSDAKKANQGAVSSIADTDLVMCCVNGVYHPISARNLSSILKKISCTSIDTGVNAKRGDWIRVAKTSAQFSGIMSVMGSYQGNEPPVPAFMALGGYNASWSRLRVYWINNDISCVSAVRFVKESDNYYVEIKYNKDESNTIYVRLSNEYNITLMPATISNADDSNVLKTIEFSGGGYNSLSFCKLRQYFRHCALAGAERRCA